MGTSIAITGESPLAPSVMTVAFGLPDASVYDFSDSSLALSKKIADGYLQKAPNGAYLYDREGVELGRQILQNLASPPRRDITARFQTTAEGTHVTIHGPGGKTELFFSEDEIKANREKCARDVVRAMWKANPPKP